MGAVTKGGLARMLGQHFDENVMEQNRIENIYW